MTTSAPYYATQDQVSISGEATAAHGCGAPHLRWMLQHPNFVSTAIVQQLTLKLTKAFQAHAVSIVPFEHKRSNTIKHLV